MRNLGPEDEAGLREEALRAYEAVQTYMARYYEAERELFGDGDIVRMTFLEPTRGNLYKLRFCLQLT